MGHRCCFPRHWRCPWTLFLVARLMAAVKLPQFGALKIPPMQAHKGVFRMKTTNPPINSGPTVTSKFAVRFATAVITLITLFLLVQTAGAQANALDISAPVRKQPAPAKFIVPISSSDLTTEGVIAFQFNILYDPTVITPAGVNFGCITDGTLSGNAGMTASCNVSPVGVLRVAVYGAYPMSGSGTVLNLKFATVGGAGSNSTLDFQNLYFFNESGYLPTTAHNGRITLARSIGIGTGHPGDVEVSLPDVTSRSDSPFSVPVTAELAPGRAITASQFNVLYDPELMRPSGPNFGCSTDGTIGEAAGAYAFCSVMPEGVLHVAVFSAYPISTSGTLLHLNFEPTEAASDSISPLTLQTVFFGGIRSVIVRNGQVAFSEPKFSKL